jgi:hypothetical protein
VAQAYKLADRADPRLDTDKKLAFILQRQLRGYSVYDPPPNLQVAVTASVLREFINWQLPPMTKLYVTYL